MRRNRGSGGECVGADTAPPAEKASKRNLPPPLTVFSLVEDFPACHICGHADRRPLYLRKRFLALGCTSCGVVETYPQPPDDAVAAYYEAEDGWERAKTWRKGERELDQFLAKRRIPFRAEIGVLEAHLEPPAARNGRRPKVLDFGCGIGVTLDVFGEHGWDTYGIEIAPHSRVIAGARHVVLDEIPRHPTFDLVVAAHVVEHLRRPRETVTELARATVDGGQIYVAVPSFERLPEHGHFGHLLNTQHLYAYTAPAMKALLTACGYADPRILDGSSWEPVRDSVRSMRVLARRSAGTSAALEARPLDPAMCALRAYARTPAGEEFVRTHRL